MHIYGLTETYGPITTSGIHPEWEDLEIEERARLMARQGQGYIHLRPRAGGGREHERRRSATARRSARS